MNDCWDLVDVYILLCQFMNGGDLVRVCLTE